VIQPLLRGQTVTLRPLAVADAGALAAAAAESRGRYVYTRVPDGVEDAQRYIETALASVRWAVGSRSPSCGRIVSPAVAWPQDRRAQRPVRRAIERLGAIFEGVRRADMPAGRLRPQLRYYSILQVEWPDVRQEAGRRASRLICKSAEAFPPSDAPHRNCARGEGPLGLP